MPLLPAPQLQTLPSISTNNVQPIAFLKPLPFIFRLTESPYISVTSQRAPRAQ